MISALILLTLPTQLERFEPPRLVVQAASAPEALAPVVDATTVDVRPPTAIRKVTPNGVNHRRAKTQNRQRKSVSPLPATRQVSVPRRNDKTRTAHLAQGANSQFPNAADTVVVVPRVFRQALQPWLDYRSAQGHQIAIVDPDGGARSILRSIRQAAAARRLRYIVLVGDSEPSAHLDPLVRARSVPTFLEAARVNIKWGSEPEIATDNPYADLDDDGIPDVAIGRIPVNNVAQLQRFVRKVLDYERQPRAGQWQRKVNFVAGVGDFGAIADAVIESTCKRIITNGIRPEYDISMTYASWRSPYCPDPRRFRDITIARLNEGSLFWVYLGHGQLDALGEIRLPNRDDSLPIFGKNDLPRLRCRSGQPIALMLACYTGAYDHSQECLAEEMLMSSGGPIAVVAGSRVTMPYGMAILGTGMLESFFSGRCVTVGDLLLQGKQHLANSHSDKFISRKLLDSLARAIHADNDDVTAERLEHQLLFNLLGDPLLRIPFPQKIHVTAPTRATGGKTILVRGTTPISGTATIELVCRRDRMRIRTGRRMRYDDSEGALTRMGRVYDFANDKRWSAVQTQAAGGRFQARLRVPNDAQGHSHVRVSIEDGNGFAVGTHDIYIQPPKNLAEAAK